MTYSSPIPCNLSKSQIEDFAAAVVDHMGIVAGQPLGPVIERLRGEIHPQGIVELGTTSDGSIQIEEDAGFKIFLPSHTGRERDRFTIAHELGHYFLHFLYQRSITPNNPRCLKARRAGTGTVEWQANCFAAAFLMPERQFRSVHSEFAGDIFLVAERFGVSRAAATIRAETLSL